MAAVIGNMGGPAGLICVGVLAAFFFGVALGIDEGYGGADDRERWDERYAGGEYVYGRDPLKFLSGNVSLLPGGRALVLAMGEGRNAVFLAEQGYDVDGCDISPVAVKKARRLAAERGVRINAFEADLEDYTLEQEGYDLIACFYYLQRDLIAQMKAALRPGGMVIMETYTVENLNIGLHGPKNREYLLEENELLHLFLDLGMKIIFYRETVIDGEKAIASIIAQKVK
ncbi:MAG: methyltransferase domain-containing protein [Candidatus Brocadiales bacterium]|nr:methyltransferase domain-containing protein [Candidatus Bathyanammoxibius amoris]